MTFSQVEAFRAVVQLGSMTEAAHRLHTSQPQVSRLVAHLEAATGLHLFDRSGSRLTLTRDGSRFHHEVERAFVSLGSLETAAAKIRLFSAERLGIAAMPRLAGGLLARSAARFRSLYPDVVISIHSGDENTVYKWIMDGFCDAGLTMLYERDPGMPVARVLSTACVAVLPPGHRLAEKSVLVPADFEGEPFVDTLAGTPLRSQIDAVFGAAGVHRAIAAEASLGSAICTLVAAGLGVSLLNPLAAFEEAKVSPIEIRKFVPQLPVEFALVFPPLKPPSPLVKAFSACAHALLVEELHAGRDGLPVAAGSRTMA